MYVFWRHGSILHDGDAVDTEVLEKNSSGVCSCWDKYQFRGPMNEYVYMVKTQFRSGA